MKIKIPFIIVILLFLLSCNGPQEQTRPNGFAPKVVEAKGYIVPKDSITTPKTVLAGKPKVVQIGKPGAVPANTNIHPAGIPKTVMAGTPKICTPGADSFSLPKLVQAINRPFVAGIPEVAIARDAISKDQNSQNFSSFTKLHGLKGEGVTCLLQDKNGNIWIGTWHGGLSRYDGKNFTHFTEKQGLIHYGVIKIFEDRSGNIWVGTFGGLSKYDGKNFTNFTQNEGLTNDIIISIFEDKNGNIWFGTGDGLSKYDGKYFTHFTEKQGLVNNSVRSIMEDRTGDLWFGTKDGVSKYDGKTFTNYTEKEGLSNDDVSSSLEDKAGNLWFGTGGGGVNKYDGRNFSHYTKKEGLSNNIVKTILEDKAGNLWFGTEGGGVSKYDGKYFTHVTGEEGLADNSVNCILEGRSGDLWFGTENGLSKYNGKIFSHFSRKEGLGNNDVSDILEDKSGNLWFGTVDGGVSKYDGKNFTSFTKKEGFSNNYVMSILEDKAGNLWFGTGGGGVNKFDGKSITQYTTAQGLSNDYVAGMLEDSNGNLWFSTMGNGVNKFDGKSITHYSFVWGLRNQYYTPEGISNDFVLSMLEDSKGNFWFGTWGSGINKFDGKSITQFTVKEGLSGNTVTGIIEDKSGNLWIGTVGGVSKYDGKTFTHFTEKEGLSNNDVQSIYGDRSGNLWIGTAFGLNKLSLKSLLNLSAAAIPIAIRRADKDGFADLPNNDRAGEALFKSYTYEDGFLGIGCNQHAIFEDKNGTIWIGTNDRLTAYHPEGDKDTIAPTVQLTGVALFNENIPWVNLEQKKDTIIMLGNGVRVGNFKFDGLSNWYNIPEHLSLPYYNNYLSFDFVGIATNSPKKVKYQYILEGLDDNWSALTTRAEAAYGNLPPGNYSFKVRAVNSGGYWSKEINYSFTIRPPWWQTWWAYTLYLLAFVAAVSSFIAYRSRKLREENKILEGKVSQRTIQLEQKSTELEKSLDNLKSTQAQLIQSEKMASLGQLTTGIAHEIQNPLNFMNNFSEVNTELIEEMKNELISDNKMEAISIADTIKTNEEKINQHGKRADAIVKSMLQHSQINSGQKEETDINALADEYLRLAFHGFRAKDQSFNVSIHTDFDENLGKVNIIPQDIGRVLLNLYNNAFYSVVEKKKMSLNNGNEPLVALSTKRSGDKIEIRVKDNGTGIPEKVKDKIFQPFFTTKPTGQGTGLGLSLSYDIIKAHGGEIKVITKDGEGAEFIINLPGSQI